MRLGRQDGRTRFRKRPGHVVESDRFTHRGYRNIARAIVAGSIDSPVMRLYSSAHD
jgi:hypothetical protein